MFRWHFQDLNPDVPIQSAMSFLCYQAASRAATGSFYPQIELPSQLLLWALMSQLSWSFCLCFPLSPPPTFKICPSFPHSNFHPFLYCLPTHPSFSLLPRFICWLAYPLRSPHPLFIFSSLFTSSSSPSSRVCLSLPHIQGEPLLLLPPVDENGAFASTETPF